MSRDELRAAMARACAKVVEGINNLSDAQMVYLMGVVDGLEGSSAALAAITSAATLEEPAHPGQLPTQEGLVYNE